MNRYYQLRTEIGGAAARYVDQLDSDGQIDRDPNSDPYVTGYERLPGTKLVRVKLSRNGSEQSVVINPKSRSLKPERQTFDISDNWKRPEEASKPSTVQQAPKGGPQSERARRAPPTPVAPTANPSSQAGAPSVRQQTAMREHNYERALKKLLK